jgi:uncharacterized membrane protein (DUF2068 family)
LPTLAADPALDEDERMLGSLRRRVREFLRWHPETFVCARRGHLTPAASVARLDPAHAGLGIEFPDGRRLARCTRCDVWVETEPPVQPDAEVLPPLGEIGVPRRGEDLREGIIIRLIAIDRGLHSVVFGLLAAALIAVDLDLGLIRAQARAVAAGLTSTVADTGQGPTQDLLTRLVQDVSHLERRTVTILAATAVVYCVVEGVEAVGLWRERRWAEYLTAIATAGFLPFEIHELLRRITVVRVTALVLNVAILVWLVWRKHLFGVQGGVKTLGHDRPDPTVLFAPP